jgi:parallel beta-helix repeat protein
MKRLVLTIFTIALFGCGNSQAAILVFSPNGTYVTKATTLAAAAISADVAGKTVQVTSSQSVSTAISWPANTNLIIDRGVTITTTQPITFGANVTVSGGGTITGPLVGDVLIAGGNGFTVDGITVTGPVTTGNVNYSNYAGISIKGRSNVTIQNCTITGKQNGITNIESDTQVSNIKIINNTIRSIRYGIYLAPWNADGAVGIRHAVYGTDMLISRNDVRLQAGFDADHGANEIRGIKVAHFNNVTIEKNTVLGYVLSIEPASFVFDDFMTGIKVLDNTVDTWMSVNTVDGGVVSGNVIDYALRPAINTYETTYGVDPHGLELVYSKNLTVDRNVITGQLKNGLFIGQANGANTALTIAQTATNLVVSNNVIKGCNTTASAAASHAAMNLGLVRDSLFSGNLIDGNGRTSGDTGGGIFASGEVSIGEELYSPISNLQFIGNTVQNTLSTRAFYLGGSKNITIKDNTLINNAGTGLDITASSTLKTTIQNNDIRNNSGAGIKISSSATRELLVEGNILHGNTNGAVQVDATPNATDFGAYGVFRNNWGAVADTTAVAAATTVAIGDTWNLNSLTTPAFRAIGQGTVGSVYASATVAQASTTDTSTAVTLNARAAHEMCEGQLITIAGVTGLKRLLKIVPTYATNGITITGATATLSSAADATVTDAAISYSAPTIVLTGATTGTGAPGSTPSYVGQEYLDTSGAKWYKSKGTGSSADWVILN